uniref:ABC2_membrane domain-containing protein n=1 Tax=Caenorhabditis tropicalis TaxID=1561998 RepID=A0A1I7UW21_9PELO
MGVSDVRKPSKAAITIIWALLFALSVTGLIRGISYLFSVPMNYYQVFNVVSIFYNTFLFIGCIKFNVASLRAAEQIVSYFIGLLISLSLIAPLFISSFMASGVFQSYRQEDREVQYQFEKFMREEVSQLPVGYRHMYIPLMNYILDKIQTLRTPQDNFAFGLETGFIVVSILIVGTGILYFQYLMIVRLRKHIIKRRIEDARLSTVAV